LSATILSFINVIFSQRF